MIMDSKTLKKTTQAELICQQLAKFVFDPNPIAVLTNSFFDTLNAFQMNNIIDFVNDLKKRVDRLEEKYNEKFRIDEITFKEEVLPIFQKVKDEVNSNKKDLYVSFLAASIHPSSLNCNNKRLYLNYLEQLDYLSIYILNNIENECNEKKLVKKIGNNYNENEIIVHLLHLHSLGMVDKISAEEFENKHKRLGNIKLRHPENVFLYKRNRLGNEFLSFIIHGMIDTQ